MTIHTIIFDLDGTLIDSAPSILRTIQVTFNQVGIKPAKSLTEDLIGPPLKDLFSSLLSENNKEILPYVIEGFIRNYDESGYKETRVYEAVPEMLDALLKDGMSLYVATNKRLAPARKIIEHLEWTAKFKIIYTLDYFEPALKNKVEMLSCLYKCLPSATDGAVYIGDRVEDSDAAERAGFPFFMADWGYGENKESSRDYPKIAHPSMLPTAIRKY